MGTGYRYGLLVLGLFCFAGLTPGVLQAQTATSGLLSGTVTDPSNAIVPNASVMLQEHDTNAKRSTITDPTGHYVFPAVLPGEYTLQVSATGFETTVIGDVHIEVLKSTVQNISLKLGEASQTVQMREVPSAELQTTSSTVGATLGGIALERLPAFTRSASALMFLQPAVTPPVANNKALGGQVAGARSEQLTFHLDGGDATSDLEGSSNYAGPPSEPQPAPVVPVPTDSTQEFRVATSSPSATFDHSAGGQVNVITKHGTNGLHGSAYEYHSDDGLNANSWLDNRVGLARPQSVDNSFGFTLGGPLVKNRFWFFANYEGRRLHDQTPFSAVVPTSTLKSGILTFDDCANGFSAIGSCLGGNPISYPLQAGNISTACAGGSCDSRGLGISPVIAAQLALYPTGNNSNLGDGLNTTGYTFNAPTPISENMGVIRLDYQMSNKWSLFTTYHEASIQRQGPEQVNMLTNQSVATDPTYPSYATFAVTGQLTSQLTSVTHGSYLRDWWAWNREAPTPLVSSTGITQAMELAGEGLGQSNSTAKLLADPININTQQAGGRVWDGHDWYIAQDFSWLHKSHLLQFGGSGYILDNYHLQTDDVLGGLTSAPINYVEASGNGSGEYVNVPSAYQPISCSATAGISTNCLPSGQLLNWNELYSTVLGLVDRAAQVETRGSTFQPNPLGTPLSSNVRIPSFYSYFQDVWQARRNLTITAGLDWGVQLQPSEAQGKEVVMTYAATNTPVDYYQYIQNRAAALENGRTFNPQWGLMPVNSLATPFHGAIRNTPWHDIGPRVAMAWQVPWKNRLFGDNATVIRGGYDLLFDRSSTMGEVLNPLLGGGLADVDACGGPSISGTCTGAPTDPTNAFRLGPTASGWDGTTVTIPNPVTQSIPYSPSVPNGLFLSSALDPYAVPGHSHNVTVSIERSLPGKTLFEAGFIGRVSRNLAQGIQLNAPDYMMKDGASGQTYAQAFDGIAQAVRGGTSVPDEPFFDNQLGLANCTGAGYANCSTYLAAKYPSNLANGDLGSFAQMLNNELTKFGQPAMDNFQVFEFSGTTDGGFSNYLAGYVSLNKAFSSGLQFQVNWTWSHAIGNQGTNQQYVYSMNSPYNLNLDSSSEPWDHKHTINGWFYYALPFGTGGRFKAASGIVNRIIGGWYTSGIYSFATGFPTCVNADGNFGAFLAGDCALSSQHLHGMESQHKANGAYNFFADPSAVMAGLSRPPLSTAGEIPYDELRTPTTWNLDFSIGKNIASTERYKVIMSADAFNVLNVVNFSFPSLDLNLPNTFGVWNSQANSPRQLLIGLRVEF
ncbi:MAG TPA: carboxypeptidase-like regulatory domain-containing protein [Candidatus Acidoferrales bacterium]|nr:carboxypeptidase-like regulatory domain-containing protein [Candidatus Acidoferrales bacterium]